MGDVPLPCSICLIGESTTSYYAPDTMEQLNRVFCIRDSIYDGWHCAMSLEGFGEMVGDVEVRVW